jgi:DeoR/GlpR family transcriptional regulator of sugar metabolism
MSPRRHKAILATLAEQGAVRTEELAGSLHTSLATIRRDLETLHRRGMLHRTHGGALPTASRFTPTGQQIAAALALVTPGSGVGLVGGTATIALAAALADVRVTVVCCTSAAAQAASGGSATVLMLPGELDKATGVVHGPLTAQSLTGLRLDVCFLAPAGITEVLTARSLAEAETAAAMVAASQRVAVLPPPGDWAGGGAAVIAPVSRVDAVLGHGAAGVLPRV